MCSGYSGPSGSGMRAYFKDAAKSMGATVGGSGSGGVSSGGASGPSAARSTGALYMRRKAGAPVLDNMFGVDNGSSVA